MNAKEYDAKGEIRKFYENKRISLLTKHGKERIIAPILAEAVGCQVKLAPGYDTDQLGTFTREIPRIDNQINTARKKARIGMDLLGLSLGMASEGSFGPDPFTGLMPWNRELIVLIDDDMETEIIGQAQGPGNQQHLLTSDWQEAVKFATRVGFPDQYLIVRPENDNNPKIHKDINEWPKFESIFFSVAGVSATGQVFIETDGRAHGNPERRKMIAKATEDLVNNNGLFLSCLRHTWFFGGSSGCQVFHARTAEGPQGLFMQNYGCAKNAESMRRVKLLNRNGLTLCTVIFVIHNSTVRKADGKNPYEEDIQKIEHGK